MKRTILDYIVIETEIFQLLIQFFIKFCMNLEGKNQVLPAFVIKRMYLETVDDINVTFFQFVLGMLQVQSHLSFQKDADFHIVVTVRLSGGNFHKKNFKIIHIGMADDFQFFLCVHRYLREVMVVLFVGFDFVSMLSITCRGCKVC